MRSFVIQKCKSSEAKNTYTNTYCKTNQVRENITRCEDWTNQVGEPGEVLEFDLFLILALSYLHTINHLLTHTYLIY